MRTELWALLAVVVAIGTGLWDTSQVKRQETLHELTDRFILHLVQTDAWNDVEADAAKSTETNTNHLAPDITRLVVRKFLETPQSNASFAVVFRALFSLCVSNSDVVRDAVVDGSAVPLLVQYATNQDEQIALNATKMLTSLTLSSTSATRASLMPAAHVLVSKLGSTADAEERSNCAWGMYHLAVENRTRAVQLDEAGVTKAAVSALKRDLADPLRGDPTSTSGCAWLLAIVAGASEAAAHQLIDLKALDLLTPLLQSEDGVIVSSAAAAVNNVMQGSRNRTAVAVQAGVVAPLKRIVQAGIEVWGAGTIETVTSALALVMWSTEGREELVDQQTVMALHSDISLLHSSCRHPEALTPLLHLLANLVGLNSDLANDLMDTGAPAACRPDNVKLAACWALNNAVVGDAIRTEAAVSGNAVAVLLDNLAVLGCDGAKHGVSVLHEVATYPDYRTVFPDDAVERLNSVLQPCPAAPWTPWYQVSRHNPHTVTPRQQLVREFLATQE